MKKIIFAALVALASFSVSAQEQGDMAIGANLGIAPCLENNVGATNFGIGIKYQYNITDPVRLEADLEYWIKDSGIGLFDISANVHYLIPLSSKITAYPLAGIGYGHFNFTNYATSSANRFLFNVGVGTEYALNDNISLGAEIKYQFLKNFSRLPIQIGVAYKF